MPATPPQPSPSRALTLDVRGVVILLLGVLGAAALLGVFRDAADMLTKIGIGVIVALAFDPVVGAVRRRTAWSRGPATAVVVTVVAMFFGVVIVVLGPAAVDQARQFADELPETAEQLYELPLVGDRLEDEQVADRVEDWAADLPGEITDDTIERAADAILGGLASALTVLLVAITVLIDGESLVARFRRVLPRDQLDTADEVGRTFYAVIARYFAGSLLVAGIAGMFVLTLGLILGVPLTPLAAIWMALTDLIPQVGGFLGGVVFVTLAFTQGAPTGLIALGAYLVYLQIENHVLQPAIVGERVRLSPPTTMLAALVGGAAAGVPGALIATPVVGAAKQLWLRSRRRGLGADTPASL